MNKKIIISVVAVFILICAVSAIKLARRDGTEESDYSVSDISEYSAEESEVSAEPSNDVSEELSDDVSEEPSLESSEEPSDETSEEVEDDISEEKSVQPEEVSKLTEESKEEQDSEPVHIHNWKDATCIAPKICKDCGATEGTAVAHDWQPATCVSPIMCRFCGKIVSGVSNDHAYENGKCKYCGEEQVVTYGDTPVYIVVNGKEMTVSSYEDAKEMLSLEELENAEKGYVLVMEARGVTLTYVANGDGTFFNTETSRNRSAQGIYSSYIGQWCSDCGKRTGNGDNGTCVKKLIDCICSRCGKECKLLECHTCYE